MRISIPASVSADRPMAQAESLFPQRLAQTTPKPRVTQWSRAWRTLRRPMPIFSIAIVLIGVICALWPVSLLPHDPIFSDLLLRFKPPFWVDGAVAGYPLGTDNLGRDIFSRMVNGTRYSLLITVGAVVISIVIGLAAGLMS